MTVGSVGSGLLALPMLSDGMNFDLPEYYETIQTSRRATCHTVQSADLDGDGQDELICRGPAGISAYSFDQVSGQWISLPPGPAWSDAAGWALECYYATIQAADLDGDGRAELFGYGPNGTEVWSYDPTSGAWTQLQNGVDPLAGGYWDAPETYTTIQCADLDGDGSAELLARSTTGIVAWKLTSSGWTALPAGPGWSDAASWNLPQYYATIQCADVDGDGSAELIGRDNQQLQFWKLTPAGWQGLPFGPSMADSNGWNQVQYYSTIQFADLDGDGAAELLARNNTQILVWKLTESGWTSLPGGPLMPDVDAWNLPQYYTTIQCADLDGDGADELFARNNTQVAAWKLVGSAWQQLAGGPIWSDADGWNLPQYYSTIRTATVLSEPASAGGAPSTVDVLIGRTAYSMLAYRYAASGWVSTTAPWPVLNPEAYQAVSVLLGLADGQQVRELYNDSTQVLPRAHSALAGKPRPPSGYSGSIKDWDDTVAQLAKELGWVLALHGWYADIATLTNETYLIEDMSLSVVADTLALDQEADKTDLSILSFACNIAWAVLGVEFPIAAAVAGVLATACTAAATNWPSTSIEGTVTTLQAALTNAFTQAAAEQATQQLAITGGEGADGQPVAGDYGLLAAIGEQIDSANPAWSWNPTAQQSLAQAGVQSYTLSCWQTLVVPANWRWSANPYVYGLDPSYAAYLANGWCWDLYGTGEGCNSYFTVQYLGPISGASLVLAETAQLLFGPDSPASAGPMYPLLVAPSDVLTGQNGWPQLTGERWQWSYTGCKNVPPPYTAEVAAGGSAPGVPMPHPTADRLPIVPTRANGHEEISDQDHPAPRTRALQVRARVLRVVGGEVLVRVTTSNHGLEPAEAVEIVEASLAGRPARGALPTRPTRIGVGCRVSRQLWFPLPSEDDGQADLQVRVLRRGGEQVESVALTVP